MTTEKATQKVDGLHWFKSSYSSGEGGECVEVALSWVKSSHSSDKDDACVEVASCPDVLHVRDSKVVGGPVLDLSPTAWSEFVAFATQHSA
ncbi:DUF397 domain-containing protein [Streptomyces oceani]|uniref:Toxin n=1 Tax=Streptomyces oceani TaxID=1075402 RepID=A0A1E7JY07_9ACTN|nr:DUF397 domain-containing protein [Streptomyces oceani]OEU96560.1 toxin [Streptomyces oceani]